MSDGIKIAKIFGFVAVFTVSAYALFLVPAQYPTVGIMALATLVGISLVRDA